MKTSEIDDWEFVPVSIHNIVYYNGLFVGVNNYASSILQYSKDGTNWTSCKLNGGNGYFDGIFFADENYLYITGRIDGNNYPMTYRSADGKTFDLIEPSPLHQKGYELLSSIYSKSIKSIISLIDDMVALASRIIATILRRGRILELT